MAAQNMWRIEINIHEKIVRQVGYLQGPKECVSHLHLILPKLLSITSQATRFSAHVNDFDI